ncbi:hypothetical protein M1293_00695 [Candidatus Parvarchaeota archaeon]|nr:hypothetical protein [Candidatus Parvarchaeota archaeon]
MTAIHKNKKAALSLGIEIIILIVIALALLVVILFLIKSGIITPVSHLTNTTPSNISSSIP